MSLMETSQLMGNFGEFFGAIAVVATLIYLAVQVRQNSAQLRIASNQTSADSYTGLIANVLDNPDNFGWFKDGLESYHSLEPAQQAQFHMHLFRHFVSYRNNLVLAESGSIPDSMVIEQTLNVARVLKCPGAQEWLGSIMQALEPDARDYWGSLRDQVMEIGKDAQPITEVLPFLRKS